MAIMKTERYPLKNNDEIRRLTDQHEVIKDAMGGKLLIVPVDSEQTPLRILDSATANGLWIRDLACTSAMGTTFIGTDINISFLPQDGPDVIYAEQDINIPWPYKWHGAFDVVHQRLALAACGPAQQNAINNLAALVKPGGWIQLLEGENVPDEKDGPAMHDFIQLIRDIYSPFGTDPVFVHRMSEWLEEAGFADVGEHVVNCEMGASNRNPKLQGKGRESMVIAAKGLVNFAKCLPSLPNLSEQQIDSLVPRLTRELEERGGNYPLRVVWGRKPL